MKPLMVLFESLNSSYPAVATMSPEMTWAMNQFYFDELPNDNFEQRRNYSRANLIIDYLFNSISVCFVTILFNVSLVFNYCFSPTLKNVQFVLLKNTQTSWRRLKRMWYVIYPNKTEVHSYDDGKHLCKR